MFRNCLSLIFLLFLGMLGFAGPVTVKLQPSEQVPRTVLMENDVLSLRVELGRNIYLASFFDKRSQVEFVDSEKPAPLAKLNNQWHLLKVGFNVWSVEKLEQPEGQGVKIELFSNYLENPYHLFITLLLGDSEEVLLDVRLENQTDPNLHDVDYTSRETLLSGLSLLKYLKPRGAGKPYVIFKKGWTYFHNDTSGPGMYFLRQEESPTFPTVVCFPKRNAGILLNKHQTDLNWSFENASEALSFMQPTSVKPGDSFVLFRGTLLPFSGDWHVALRWWKDWVRGQLDLSNYSRPGHLEYRKKVLCSFTMAFDHSFYDPEKNEYRLDSFLDRGEREFGGYDFILFWHGYPRLGVDPRDEWEMYQGLPSGVEGLQRLVTDANNRGVWVFLSYNPWDVIGNRPSLAEAQARVMRETGANGTYLDIMRGATTDFRDVFDRVNPDIVFSSENRPPLKSLEVSTGSQEDHEYVTQMPRLDLLRFVLPEHNISNTERMARDRTLQIRTALFKFVGLTIWEDIFGEINRYSWDERVLIYRFNKLAHDYLETFTSLEAEPLVPARVFKRTAGETPYETAWDPNPPTRDHATLQEEDSFHTGLHVNRFSSTQQKLFSLYHQGHGAVDRFHDNRIMGKLFQVEIPDSWHLVNVWDGLPVEIVEEQGKKWAFTRTELPDPSCVIAAVPSLIRVNRSGEVWMVSVGTDVTGDLRLVGFDLERRPVYRDTVPAGAGLVFGSESAPANVDGYVMIQLLKDRVVRDVVTVKILD